MYLHSYSTSQYPDTRLHREVYVDAAIRQLGKRIGRNSKMNCKYFIEPKYYR
jgi:hypothetical protein